MAQQRLVVVPVIVIIPVIVVIIPVVIIIVIPVIIVAIFVVAISVIRVVAMRTVIRSSVTINVHMGKRGNDPDAALRANPDVDQAAIFLLVAFFGMPHLFIFIIACKGKTGQGQEDK